MRTPTTLATTLTVLLAQTNCLADAVQEPLRRIEMWAKIDEISDHMGSQWSASRLVHDNVQECLAEFKADKPFIEFEHEEPLEYEGHKNVAMIIFSILAICCCCGVLASGLAQEAGAVICLVPAGCTAFCLFYVLSMDQCYYMNNLTFRLNTIKLLTDTTDSNWFGHGEDDIVFQWHSILCRHETAERKFEKGTVHHYEEDLPVWYSGGVEFMLVEKDSMFEGADDLSNKVSFSSETIAKLRRALKSTEGDIDEIPFKVPLTVKGGNLFTETFLGQVLENFLCVSAVDFVLGPAFSRARKVIRTAAFPAAQRAFKVTSKKAFTANNWSKINADAGIFKYGFKEMMARHARKSVEKMVTDNVLDYMEQKLIEEIVSDHHTNQNSRLIHEHWDAIMPCAMQKMLPAESEPFLDAMNKVNQVLDAITICPTDVMPAVDAVYTVEMSVHA